MPINDANSQLDKIVTELQRLNKSIANSGGGGSTGSGGRATDTRTNSAAKNINSTKREFDGNLMGKSFGFLRKGIKDVTKEIDELSKSANRERTSLHELYNSQTKLIKTIVSHDKVLNSLQDDMKHSVQDQIKGMSFLGKGVMEMAGTMRDLTNTLEESEDLLKDFNDGLDDIGKATLDEIQTKKDFVKFYSKMQHHLALDAKKSAEIDALVNKGKIEQAKELVKQEVENAKTIRDVTAHVSSRYYMMSRAASTVSESFKKMSDAAGMGFLGQMATLGGSLGLIGMGVKQAYTELWNVGNSGLGGAYGLLGGQVRGASKQLGVSVDAFAKTFQQNANIAATMGFAGFVNTLKSNQHSLMSLGLGQEEAAKATTAFAQNARLGGVNLRDSNSLNKSVRQQTNAFEKMRAITGVTADEYASQNKSLLESSVMQESMARMTKNQRVQALQEISMSRQRLAIMGMSNDQQLEFIKTMKQNSNQSVTDRFKDGGDLLSAFSAAGMGQEGMQAYNMVVNKQTDSPEFQALLAKLNDSMNSMQAGSLGTQNLADQSRSIRDKYGAPTLNAAKNNKDNVPTPAEQTANAKLGKLSDATVNVKVAIGQLNQELSDPLWKIVAGVGGILAMMVGGKLLGGLKSIGKKVFGVNRVPGTRAPATITGSTGPAAAAAAARVRASPANLSRTSTGGFRDNASGRLVSRTDAHARIQGQYWNPRAAGPASPGRLSRAGSAIRSGAATAGGAVMGGARAAGGMAMKGAGIAAKVGLKAIPFIGWAYAAGSAIYDGFKAVEQANEIFGTQAATTSQKIAAGIGGAIESLTFGLLPTDATAKFIEGATSAAKEIGSKVYGGIAGIYNSVVNVTKSITGFIGESVSKFGTWLSDKAKAVGAWIKGKTGIDVGALWQGAKNVASNVSERVGTTVRQAATTATNGAYNFTGSTPKFSGEVNGAINNAASKNGVDPAMMRTMAMIESNGRTNAVSSTGAKGLYQFVGGTAKQYGIKGNEFDPNANADAAARLFKDNQASLTKRGIAANGINTYLAHQLGAGGASSLIRAKESGTDVSPSLRKAMDLNGGKGLDAQQFYQMWTNKYNQNYAKANAGVNGSETQMASATVSAPVNAKPSAVAKVAPVAAPQTTSVSVSAGDATAAQALDKKKAATAVASTDTVKPPSKSTDKFAQMADNLAELVALAREQNMLGKASMFEQRVANLQPSFSGSGPSAVANGTA